MMMLAYWVKIIPARWLSGPACGVVALLLTAVFAGAQTLGSLSRAYHDTPAPARHAALERFAGAHPKDQDGALALLVLGIGEQAQKQPADAIRHLREAGARLPSLRDYAAYYIGAAELDAKNFAAAAVELEPVWSAAPVSPLVPDAAMTAGRAYKERGTPADAVRVLRQYYSQLPQPAGDFLLASSYAAAADSVSAAVYYQRIYFHNPATPEAEQAAAALADLKSALGTAYPPAMPQAMFQRAGKWLAAGDYRRARGEYEWIITNTAGADRDLARVRLGEVDYFRDENAAAYSYLKPLAVASPEADAERLYYLVELARRMEREDEMMNAVNRLAEIHHESPWRLKALITAGNRYVLENRSDAYEPLYRACFEGFPAEPQAGYCHWKVAWNAYIHRRPDAPDLLREHLVKFPGSEHSSAALYFLGRISEAKNQFEDAKAYYNEAVERFPNHYYADLVDQRLLQPALFRALSSPATRAFLNGVWPVQRYPGNFEPAPATQARIKRASLLERAGLEDLAERELRYGALTDGQPHVLGVHLAQRIAKYDSPPRAMRLLKSLVPGYLAIPIENAPPAFWRLLFPLPYRAAIERYAKQNGLDPFLVAGLVRQESEFDPDAVSAARAYGLTQILPSTGRVLLKVSRRRFRPSILFRPDVNLRLGAAYLRRIYDQNSATWETALASYNAGGLRVENWLTWAQYREPAEFVETIPFSETRSYVFSVLRNAGMYRKLYGPDGPLAADGAQPLPKKLALTGEDVCFEAERGHDEEKDAPASPHTAISSPIPLVSCIYSSGDARLGRHVLHPVWRRRPLRRRGGGSCGGHRCAAPRFGCKRAADGGFGVARLDLADRLYHAGGQYPGGPGEASNCDRHHRIDGRDGSNGLSCPALGSQTACVGYLSRRAGGPRSRTREKSTCHAGASLPISWRSLDPFVRLLAV